MEYELDDRYHVITTNNWTNCSLIIGNYRTGEILTATCNEVDKHGYSKLVFTIASSLYDNVVFTIKMVREDNIKGITFDVRICDHMPIPVLYILHDNYSEDITPDLNMSVNNVYFDIFLYEFSETKKKRTEEDYFDNTLPQY